MNTVLLISSREITATDKTAIANALNAVRSDLQFAVLEECPSPGIRLRADLASMVSRLGKIRKGMHALLERHQSLVVAAMRYLGEWRGQGLPKGWSLDELDRLLPWDRKDAMPDNSIAIDPDGRCQHREDLEDWVLHLSDHRRERLHQIAEEGVEKFKRRTIQIDDPRPFQLVSPDAAPVTAKAKLVADDRQRQEQVAELYRIYPKKKARKAAYKAIEKALREVDFRRLLERTTAYAKAVALWPKSEFVFVPHPSSWFNQGCWDDDPETWVRVAPAPRVDTASPVVQQRLRELRSDLRSATQSLENNTRMLGANHVSIPMIKKKITKLEAEIAKIQPSGGAPCSR